MRIAIFSDNFYPELSGISDSLIILAKALTKRGHQIAIFAPKYSKENYQFANEQTRELELDSNIQIVRFGSLPFPGSGTKQARLVIPTFWRWLKVKKFKPDILHTNHFFGLGLEALIAKKLLKLPLVGTNHTAITEFVRYSPIQFKSLPQKSWRYANWYYNHCQLVTAPGGALLKEMEQNGLKSPHEIIPNPVDNETFFFTPGQKLNLKKEFGLGDQTIVYAGRIAPEKNIDVLVQALPLVRAKLPGITLVLAGQGHDFEKIKALAKKLKVEGSVKFLGTINKPTLAKLYNAAETFVIASTSEVQSMTILQAMACGLPIIGTRSRGIIDCVKENGFLFTPGKPQELADKIVSVLSDRNLRQKFSQKSLLTVKNYSAETVAETWEKAYTKITESAK